jgi:peptidyl-prolyl cis-trans isomerase A (cyclophilin A)
MQKILLIAAVIIAVAVGGYFLLNSNQGGEPVSTGEETEMASTSGGNPIVVMETNMGTIKLELFLDKAPISAQNFIDLTEKGFYDGLIFHRIIEGFMVQGGDPEGTGMGGPGHSIVLEIHPELRHDSAGILAMARSNDPDSAGSQFYITLAPQPRLDDQYAVFGKVTEGLEVVMAMGSVATDGGDRPVEDVIISTMVIESP